MDPTLIVILLLIILGTVLAIIQSRRRDKCLKDIEGYHVTLAVKDGKLCWGTVGVFTSGIEIDYVDPVISGDGHTERSYIFYKEQYPAMVALFRYPDGLTEEARRRRAQVIERTVNPGLFPRIGRRLRNWIGMVRDALLQVVGVLIGTAKTRAPGSAVLSSQEQGLRALSTELIGHAGNVYDPLLERHLNRQVVVEVTREGRVFSYSGWLKDYSSEFVELLDAEARHADPLPLEHYSPGDERLPDVTITLVGRRLGVMNNRPQVLFLREIEAGDWTRFTGVVLPTGFTAHLTLPPGVDLDAVRVHMGSAGRVDVVVPRTHALVRHAGE